MGDVENFQPPPPPEPMVYSAVEPDAPPPGTHDETPPGISFRKFHNPPTYSSEIIMAAVASKESTENSQPSKQKRSRWGPVPEAFAEEYNAATEAKKKKKRKSRWEQPPPGEEGAIIARPVFPKELTLPGGIRVNTLSTDRC